MRKRQGAKLLRKAPNHNRMNVKPIEVSVNISFIDPLTQGLQQMTDNNLHKGSLGLRSRTMASIGLIYLWLGS